MKTISLLMWTMVWIFAFSQAASRIFLLTKTNVLLADQKSGTIKSEVPLGDVTKVSMSSQNDGFFAVHLKEVGYYSITKYVLCAVMWNLFLNYLVALNHRGLASGLRNLLNFAIAEKTSDLKPLKPNENSLLHYEWSLNCENQTSCFTAVFSGSEFSTCNMVQMPCASAFLTGRIFLSSLWDAKKSTQLIFYSVLKP